jgi:hypothetical protein
MYVGGRFAHVGGAEMQKVAAVDVASGVARDSFNASINAVPVGTQVRGLVVTNSALYLGGVFAPLRPGDAANLAAVSLDSGEPTGWSATVDGPVDTLSVGNDALYAGGSWASMGASGQRGLAAFAPGAGAPVADASCLVQGRPKTVEVQRPGNSTLPVPAAVVSPAKVQVPAIARLTVQLSRLRSGRRTLIVRFRASIAGLVRVSFEQDRRGRFVRIARATVHAKRGANIVSYPAFRVGRRVLGRGSYRVRVAATAVGIANGTGQTASFTVR